MTTTPSPSPVDPTTPKRAPRTRKKKEGRRAKRRAAWHVNLSELIATQVMQLYLAPLLREGVQSKADLHRKLETLVGVVPRKTLDAWLSALDLLALFSQPRLFRANSHLSFPLVADDPGLIDKEDPELRHFTPPVSSEELVSPASDAAAFGGAASYANPHAGAGGSTGERPVTFIPS